MAVKLTNSVYLPIHTARGYCWGLLLPNEFSIISLAGEQIFTYSAYCMVAGRSLMMYFKSGNALEMTFCDVAESAPDVHY